MISDIQQQLLEEVGKTYREQGKLTDEVLSSLQFVFHSPLLPALDLVDKRAVSRVSCPAGRCVYQVTGSSGTPYTCFRSNTYCTCPAYTFSVLMKDDHLMCKHVLAIKLSQAMSLVKEVVVTDEEVAAMIKSSGIT